MRPILKVSLMFMAVAILSIAAYISGYFQGYLGGVGHPAIGNAYVKVVVLNALRENRAEDAIKQLEMNLDGEIIMFVNYEQSAFQLTRLFETGGETVLVQRVAEYRRQHPSEFPDAEIRKAISDRLHLSQ